MVDVFTRFDLARVLDPARPWRKRYTVLRPAAEHIEVKEAMRRVSEGEAQIALDSRGKELGILILAIQPHYWSPRSGGYRTFGAAVNRASGAQPGCNEVEPQCT